MRYARVHVDIAAKGLDRGFDYYIPEDYPCAVVPGLCVSVRFGPRTLEGLVTDVLDETDVPTDKLRPLGLPRLDGRAVSEELMQLAKWMARQYHCSLSTALRPILPPGARSDKARAVTRMCPELIVTKEAAQLFIDTCPARFSRQIALVSLLLQDADLAAISQALPDWRQSAKSLEKKGIVRIAAQTVERTPYENITASTEAPKQLTEAQARAVSRIQSAVAAGQGEYYLFGVTGSGKTEVYLQCAKYAMELGKSTIILVPEIALTPQMVQRFRDRFGESVSVL
ncbi:MAG: DEAD/DEAH box helicase family protein, partial [Clostridia bacterium]|nr:DEAD/DEAH box helicase family protein [Clostridia bacterium]